MYTTAGSTDLVLPLSKIYRLIGKSTQGGKQDPLNLQSHDYPLGSRQDVLIGYQSSDF